MIVLVRLLLYTALCWSLLDQPLPSVHSFHILRSRKCRAKHFVGRPSDDGEIPSTSSCTDSTRRNALLLLLTLPLPAQAGDVGNQITQVVTTSNLGLSVRESVVRGAQVMDKLDGQWEQFSDSLGLGSERSKQPGRPKEKQIPPLKPLDTTTAREIIQLCDEVFVEASGVSRTMLQRKVANMVDLLQPSFQRSATGSLAGELITAEQLNFIAYTHFRTYGEVLTEFKVDFVPFLKKFEKQLGERLWKLIDPDYAPFIDTDLSKNATLANRIYALEKVEQLLVDKGLVAQVDQSLIQLDRLEDWEDGVTDLSFNVALDLDATLGAQILLAEQGFRLLPCFGRYILLDILQMKGQKVTIDPYYFDTNYNSNPALFQVKEVLLNVVLENAL